MPKCLCGKSVTSETLCVVGRNDNGWPEDELRCASCRRMRAYLHKAEERVMGDLKSVARIELFEAGENEEGEMNYSIHASVRMGGLTIELERTTDEIRQYLTEKRAKAESKKRQEGVGLKAVSKSAK